jgi:hypothetical protein
MTGSYFETCFSYQEHHSRGRTEASFVVDELIVGEKMLNGAQSAPCGITVD